MPGQTNEEKAHRTSEVRRPGAKWCGEDRTGNNRKSCGLLHRIWTSNICRPVRSIGPVIGKPLHRALERSRRHVFLTDRNAIEGRSSIKHDRRNTLAPKASGLAKHIGDKNELFA